ncbi:helix-turn-helix transcriptional regulator [Clostridium botulinum]|uniref:Helix-turn-helix transcriptional regulator n=1 Tax=Clostridium botulinum TaxID=1491 RepID=A0A846JB89_CLOBO|nr:helix-turn-helix transcriptional regulator [Clostridium botulinum]ACA54220.1 putative DNA-binding protein [Clostridium botulinum A3 str. Loch Maree]NFH66605.1 helix-turn-helix transcriptional regulator [Clostridium botulinum]NFJ10360.1 helix-turn-helix transcriptional regulator [Clostridium botulinum]NFK15734.1 helix-turn-helix transcriptional regulator [Clostridium botulinum]NFM95419.1 helix-turn-helix transcriptional regulator [Clostridium botulinum]
MAIKNKLLDIRLSMGYKTQKEFAEFLGIRRVQYNKYENNKEQPTLEALYKISLKLNIKMENIIYLDE